MRRPIFTAHNAVVLACAALPAQAAVTVGCERAKAVEFRVTLPKDTKSAAVDGRLLVMLSRCARHGIVITRSTPS